MLYGTLYNFSMREVSTTALKMRTFTPHQIWTSINTRGQAGCNYDTDRLITQETETVFGPMGGGGTGQSPSE